MEPVVREDDAELCGFVDRAGTRWRALTVFGSAIGEHEGRDAAESQVLAEGLAALAERWTLSRPGHDDEIVCIIEANPHSVTVALGYYTMPGVPTLTIQSDQLGNDGWSLTR